MIGKKFNDEWQFQAGSLNMLEMFSGASLVQQPVTLPHDAMFYEKRTPDVKNGSHTGFYPGNTYTYTKLFFVPDEWQDKEVTFEFEGIYMNAFVYINGDFAGKHPYGYTNFYISANDFLKYGQENQIKVISKSGMEETSRWYTGGGIYRDVNIYVSDQLHIKMNGMKITTPEIDNETAVVMVNTAVENNSRNTRKVFVLTEISDAKGNVICTDKAPLTAYAGSLNNVRQRLAVDHPTLWSCETLNLYHCSVKILEGENIVDQSEDNFGIRKLQLDAKHGLRINGVVTKLRGTCIHHDNGIIGACTLERAEERRCEQLKSAGFNCIRSAHNPISKAMLAACDRIGMLVMDETFDMWNNSKTNYDYSMYFAEWWEADVEAMVEKDYNHPCVIMYSMGNEILEAGTAKGAEINRRIADKIRSIDDTRYVTNAVNALITISDSLQTIIGEAIAKLQITPPAADMQEQGAGDDSGSNGLNTLLSLLSGPLGGPIMSHPIVNKRTEEIYAGMDIAGMNYMSGRYEYDHEAYPNRIILGTETFPADIANLWGLVKRNPHVIGDMTWTGYDYMGEAGCAIPYYDGKSNFGRNWPDRYAYMGDIDIAGNRRPISYLREIVYGLRKEPYIAVERVNRYGQKHSSNPWMDKDHIASWTWPGYEGKPAIVNVFSASDEVELFVNGVSLGKKAAGEENKFTASFETVYTPGNIMVVGYTGGKEDGRIQLQTAGENVCLSAKADRSIIKADGVDLSYILISVCDKDGNVNTAVEKKVTVLVEGSGKLQGLGSANPSTEECFVDVSCNTYDGYALAAVRAGKEPGTIKVTVSAEGCDEQIVTVQVQ